MKNFLVMGLVLCAFSTSWAAKTLSCSEPNVSDGLTYEFESQPNGKYLFKAASYAWGENVFAVVTNVNRYSEDEKIMTFLLMDISQRTLAEATLTFIKGDSSTGRSDHYEGVLRATVNGQRLFPLFSDELNDEISLDCSIL